MADRPPLAFDVAKRAHAEMIRTRGPLMLTVDPRKYIFTVSQVRPNAHCETCGDAHFVRMDWPLNHPYFGRSIHCPMCGDKAHV